MRQTLCWTPVHLSQHATPLSAQLVYNYTGRDTGNRRAAWVTHFTSREKKKKKQSVARARPGLAELWVLTRTLPWAPLLNCGPSSCPRSTDSHRHKAWCQRGPQETGAAYGALNNVQWVWPCRAHWVTGDTLHTAAKTHRVWKHWGTESQFNEPHLVNNCPVAEFWHTEV